MDSQTPKGLLSVVLRGHLLLICWFCSFVQVKACVLCVHPRTRVVRLSLRPIFLHPGRPLSRISYQELGAVLDNGPVQGFFKNAGAIFRLKDGVLAYARVRRLFWSRIPSLEGL